MSRELAVYLWPLLLLLIPIVWTILIEGVASKSTRFTVMRTAAVFGVPTLIAIVLLMWR